MTYEQLEAQYQALPDPLDIPNTPRAQEEDARIRSLLLGRMSSFKTHTHELAVKKPLLEKLQAAVATNEQVRDKLCAELGELEHPKTDIEHGKRANLALSIRVLDRGYDLCDGTVAGSGWGFAQLRVGKLLQEAGVEEWLGTTVVLQRRIQDLQKEIANAEYRVREAMKDEL